MFPLTSSTTGVMMAIMHPLEDLLGDALNDFALAITEKRGRLLLKEVVLAEDCGVLAPGTSAVVMTACGTVTVSAKPRRRYEARQLDLNDPISWRVVRVTLDGTENQIGNGMTESEAKACAEAMRRIR